MFKNLGLNFILAYHHLHLVDDRSISRLLHYLLLGADDIQQARSKQPATVAILGFQFGLFHVVVPLSFLGSISLASLLL